MKRAWGLINNVSLIPAPPSEFNYTNQGGCVNITGIDDQSEFNNAREAMQLLGFHSDHEAHLFQVLASILHLGNVEVGVAHSGGEDIAEISLDDVHLMMSSELLGVDRAQLRLWLTHRLIVTARERFKKPLSPSQVGVLYMYVAPTLPVTNRV